MNRKRSESLLQETGEERQEWRSVERRILTWKGKAGGEWTGLDGNRKERRGKAGVARRGMASPGEM